MEILEREAQMAVLEEAFQRVRQTGEGLIVLLSGEAGIGKTTLVNDFTRRQHRSQRVWWGGCDSLFTPRPLGPLYDIALTGAPGLLDLLNRGANWFPVASALLASIQETPDPTIVVFEDIHWADEATLDLLKYLGRRAGQARALMILTYRDELDRSHPLHSVLGDFTPQNTVQLALGPLSQAAVEALAQRAGRPAGKLYAVTRGNPFFVTEVLRNRDESIPATVREAVLTRLSHLPAAARDLLELVSIVPGAIELWLFEKILAAGGVETVPPSARLAAIDACIQAGFLTSTGEALTFQHELARQAIEASLPFGRSQKLHQAVLQALLEAPLTQIPLARIVHHAAGAGDQEKLSAYAPRAAQQASRQGAHREAAGYYQLALRYQQLLPVQACAGLLDGLSFEQYLTGQMKASIELRQQAAGLWGQAGLPERLGDDLRWLSRLYWFSGDKKSAEAYWTRLAI